MGLRDTTQHEGAEGMKGHLLNLFFQEETHSVSTVQLICEPHRSYATTCSC